MAFQINHTSNFTKLIIIVEFLVVSYLLYTLTKSVYQSYQIDLRIDSLRKERDAIVVENKQKEADYSYYSSDAYIEKIAKQNLGLVNPGEQVIVIPSTAFQNIDSANTQDPNSDQARVLASSNPQKWWKFFFDIQAKKP